MRADNGMIFLDTIEEALKGFTPAELETIAAGEQGEAQQLLQRLRAPLRKTLNVILNACFDGV